MNRSDHGSREGRDFVRERMEHIGTVLGAVGALELWDLANEAGRRVLRLLPCPSHGECAPHAEEQIAKLRAVAKAARTAINRDGSVILAHCKAVDDALADLEGTGT